MAALCDFASGLSASSRAQSATEVNSLSPKAGPKKIKFAGPGFHEPTKDAEKKRMGGLAFIRDGHLGAKVSRFWPLYHKDKSDATKA